MEVIGSHESQCNLCLFLKDTVCDVLNVRHVWLWSFWGLTWCSADLTVDLLSVVNFAWPPRRIHYPDNSACGPRLVPLVLLPPSQSAEGWYGTGVCSGEYELNRKHLRDLCTASATEQRLCCWTYPSGFTQLWLRFNKSLHVAQTLFPECVCVWGGGL